MLLSFWLSLLDKPLEVIDAAFEGKPVIDDKIVLGIVREWVREFGELQAAALEGKERHDIPNVGGQQAVITEYLAGNR
jgi:hypothetical protein